jgi:integrase
MTMHLTRTGAATGHVFRVERIRGPRWYVKYRLPDGRQVQRLLGPAWTQSGRPAAGHWTKRLAEAELRRILTDAQRGVLPGMVRTGVTFEQATAEWLRYAEQDRDVKPSTLGDYRNMVRVLNRSLGHLRLEDITVDTLERWRDGYVKERSPSNRTLLKYTIALGGVFKRAMRVHGLPNNPASLMERPRLRRTKEITVLSAAEVRLLTTAAATREDATIFLTAAFTGLRMGELLALRWRDIDFAREAIHVRASFAKDLESTPKSGSARTVPMVTDVAQALDNHGKREHFTGPGDLVFTGSLGGHLDSNRLRKRYAAALTAAGLPAMRFHELRHTFGTLAIQRASILQVQNWLGHADIKTTQVYLRYRSQAEDAALLSEVFAIEAAAGVRQHMAVQGRGKAPAGSPG